MPKAESTVVFTDHPQYDYFFLADFWEDRETYHTLKLSIPGFDKDSFPKCRVPIEMAKRAAELFRSCGYRVVDKRRDFRLSLPKICHPVAHPYQKKAAAKLVSNRTFMLAHEMGIGKCLATILALQEIEHSRVLIVCPANVRSVWQDEIEKWWCKKLFFLPAVFTLDTGAKAKGYRKDETGIVITSYGLAQHLTNQQWDVIVTDESHYYANAKQSGRIVKRSKAIRDLLMRNKGAYKWALTGTPITNEPVNLHNQLDCLWPGRFGGYWDFAYHYCQVDSTDYTDYWVHGVNKAYSKELEERLKFCVDRKTKDDDDVAPYMLPFECQPIRVKAKRGFKPRELWESLSRMDFHREKAASEAIIRSCGCQKVTEAIAWGEEAVLNGQTICILTHLKQTAKDIEAGLRKKGVPVWRFDGDKTVKQREAFIRTALSNPEPGVLVCTMHSVKEGINTMAGFDGALLAELYYTPGTMEQVLGRFHRASAACNVWILFVEGSHEEVIAMRLKEKMDNTGKAYKKGKMSNTFSEALGQEEDEEEAFDRLRSVAAQRIEEDCYA